MSIVRKIAEMIQKDDKITEEELNQLDAAVLADEIVTDDERQLVNAIVGKVRTSEQKDLAPLEMLRARIEADGVITEEELDDLHSVLMTDGNLGSEEQAILQSIVDKLRSGKLKKE